MEGKRKGKNSEKSETGKQTNVPDISLEEFAKEFFKENNFGSLLDFQLEVIRAASEGKVMVISCPRPAMRRQISEAYQKFNELNRGSLGYFDKVTGKTVITASGSVITAVTGEEGKNDIG